MLTSPQKGETAVHGCNPTLSVSVVIVSRKVNILHSISALQFCLYFSNLSILRKICVFKGFDSTSLFDDVCFFTWKRLNCACNSRK